VCACVGLLFTVLSVFVLFCAASGVIRNDDDDDDEKIKYRNQQNSYINLRVKHDLKRNLHLTEASRCYLER